MKIHKFMTGMIVPLIVIALQGCSSKTQSTATGESAAAPVNNAVAVLSPAGGSNVGGVVHFTKVADGVRITADITGLTPGKHGFHIHEYGDCSASDATSAGGHYNPTGAQHGSPTDAERHVGDLGNVEADTSGVAHYDRVDSMVKLNGEHSVVGLAVIVHAGEDDFTSQPTGNAGARVACGTIGIAKGK